MNVATIERQRRHLFHEAHLMLHIPKLIKDFVGEDGYDKVQEIWKKAGFNPNDYEKI